VQTFHKSRSVYEISSAQGAHDMFVQVFDQRLFPLLCLHVVNLCWNLC